MPARAAGASVSQPLLALEESGELRMSLQRHTYQSLIDEGRVPSVEKSLQLNDQLALLARGSLHRDIGTDAAACAPDGLFVCGFPTELA